MSVTGPVFRPVFGCFHDRHVLIIRDSGAEFFGGPTRKREFGGRLHGGLPWRAWAIAQTALVPRVILRSVRKTVHYTRNKRAVASLQKKTSERTVLVKSDRFSRVRMTAMQIIARKNTSTHMYHRPIHLQFPAVKIAASYSAAGSPAVSWLPALCRISIAVVVKPVMNAAIKSNGHG